MAAYLWHRYAAHTDIIPGVHDTHKIHHYADLRHEAHEDFIWILILLTLLGIGLFMVWYCGYMVFPTIYFITAYLLILMVFAHFNTVYQENKHHSFTETPVCYPTIFLVYL